MSETVLDRLWAGTMRCDGAWPAERLETPALVESGKAA